MMRYTVATLFSFVVLHCISTAATTTTAATPFYVPVTTDDENHYQLSENKQLATSGAGGIYTCPDGQEYIVADYNDCHTLQVFKLTNDLTTLTHENDNLRNEQNNLTKLFTTYKRDTVRVGCVVAMVFLLLAVVVLYRIQQLLHNSNSNNPDEPSLSKVHPSDNHDDGSDDATVISDEEDVHSDELVLCGE